MHCTMWAILMKVMVGLVSLAVASGMLPSLAALRRHKDYSVAVGGAVVSVTQGLGQCRLLLVTPKPKSDFLDHVLEGLRGGGGVEVVVMEDTSPLSTSLIVPRLSRDTGAACWSVVLLLAGTPPATFDKSAATSHYEENTPDYETTIENNNQAMERFLEKSGLWMLPEIRVLVVVWDTFPTFLLQHPGLRNTRHLFILHLTTSLYGHHGDHTSDKGWMMELYRRCLFCPLRERNVELLLREKTTQMRLNQQHLLLGRLVDLKGFILRVVTMDYFPHVDYQREPNHQPGGKVLPKDCLDFRMLHTIGASLNFSYEIREPPDGQWGVRDDDGHFTGIVGSLEREESDLSMVLTPTPDRLEVMDHSRIYGEGAFVIISLKPRPPTQQWAFVKSFKDEVWITLLGIVVVWGVLLWLMLKALAWMKRNKVVKWNSLTSAILYGLGALLEDPPHRPPTNLSSQVMVGWWWMLCIIITTAYRSSLISHLTVPGLSRPVNTFDDLLAREGWTWSAESGLLNMADRDFFLGSPSAVVREVYRRMEFYTLEGALQRVLKGRHSLITWKNYIDVKIASRYSDRRGITPLYISTRRYPIFGGYSWGFREGAPFLDAIKRAKQGLLETGILTYWLSDVIQQRVRETRKNAQESQHAAITDALLPSLGREEVVLGLAHLQGAFYVLFAGLLVSLISLMCEQTSRTAS